MRERRPTVLAQCTLTRFEMLIPAEILPAVSGQDSAVFPCVSCVPWLSTPCVNLSRSLTIAARRLDCILLCTGIAAGAKQAQ